MPHSSIHLRILLPYGVFIDEQDVFKINIEASNGFNGFLPNRLDCTAAVLPGIMTYEKISGETRYVALDEGIMVKKQNLVSISVRNAVTGPDLGLLHEKLEKEFIQLDEKEKDVRNTIARLESSLVREFEKIRRE